MTNDMPAGRDMDAMIIRLIPWPELDKAINYDTRLGTMWANQSDGIWKFKPGLAHLWTPSTDIRDAWDVIETLENHPNRILFEIVRKGAIDNLAWCAEFRECATQSNFRTFSAFADTAPLAICRAALLATPTPPPAPTVTATATATPVPGCADGCKRMEIP